MQEFNEFLKDAKKGSNEERIDALGSIVEEMMYLVLKLPGIFDKMMNGVTEKLVGFNEKIIKLEKTQELLLTDIKAQKTNDGSQSKEMPLPPPGPPKDKEKPEVKFERITSDTRGEIIRELKTLFDTKKKLEKK